MALTCMEKTDIIDHLFYIHNYNTKCYYCRLKSKIDRIWFYGTFGSGSAHSGMFWNQRHPKVGDGSIDREVLRKSAGLSEDWVEN